MDAPNSTPDQEKGEQQPSALPIVCEKDNSQEASDHVPPQLSLSPQEAETRHTLATEPFQPILKVLADLERDDPKPPFPRLDLSDTIDAYGSRACPNTSSARS
ncbi:hypothetical protein PENARI_c102G12309 [Penicillium arizonense]|uniref:Uncharacterized protein n=1 Tax=Penicillium arizonense TaxID=1835702 RepID=A0A1F5L0W0_PENAI|nr:hypothetical protein PENARI_c102G12309 [Penicillium arizonense]OGE46835.1 hypothetical protein PENARI_c102G12309 [Penicillium arizonense]